MITGLYKVHDTWYTGHGTFVMQNLVYGLCYRVHGIGYLAPSTRYILVMVQATSCAFMEHSHLEWVYIGPVLLLLATNTFFLVSTFTVVVTKLR